jgi:DNA-binding winged helix-turn-helix (wHTH) protein/predicted ATPase
VLNEKLIIFDPFCLDLTNECLWRGTQAIKVRPKAFAVLDYLLGHPGQLVTKEELLNAVWPGTFVGEAVLKVAIGQIREALGDDPNSPSFIETAHRRGYRFIGRITANGQAPTNDRQVRSTNALSDSLWRVSDSATGVVGRDKALSRMRSWFEKTLSGERQIVFVTGEAGIGKTALIDTFARSIAPDRNLRIGRGQCLEQYGTSEAYLPVLEAIGRLCREHSKVVDVLRAHAPMWLLQLPSLVTASDREALSREVSGATRERMLREMGNALEVLTADLPLVLIFEDLHWSDYSTLDLISYLATHRQAAQMMLIGTYRPVELIVSGHPLKAVKSELLAKQQCEELPLEYLSGEAIARYLGVRFPANRFPAELASLIHERTEGSPLFMVNAVDYLVAEGLIRECDQCWELVVEIEKVEVGVPDSIKQMIEKQIDHLDADEQRTLEAASVAGAEFSTFAVAAGLGQDRALVEGRCDELARQHQFIQDCRAQELSNGQTVSRYGFIHALYQNVLYERVSASKRAQLHQRIGEWGDGFYGECAREVAAELAMHFDRASNYRQAVKYLQQAAENDIRRFAYRESVALSRRGLELIKRLPDTPERARQELALHITLGVPLIATEGYAAPDVGTTYARARELCRQLGEPPEISQVLWGYWTFHLVRAALATAREIAEEFLRVAERLPYSGLAMEVTLIHLGEFVPAMEHFEKALSLYDPERHRDDAFRYAQNSAVATQCHAAWALWFLGQPDQALDRMQRALSLAHDLAEPHGLAHAFFFSAILHQFRGEKRMAQTHAEASLAIATEHSLLLYQATATVAQSWARIESGRQEEVEQIRRGLAAHQATGTELLRPHFLGLLVEALHLAGQVKEALGVVEEALAMADRNGERYYQAELYRLKGELELMEPKRRALSQAASGGKAVTEPRSRVATRAQDCFEQSLRIAQRQKAKSLELRATMSLARLYQNQARPEEARVLLARIYDSFTEGFDTKDLLEAKALLADLA